MSTLQQFIDKKGIKPNQILRASAKLEKKQPEDYALFLKRRQQRAASDDKSYKDAEISKPRSGRPISETQLKSALAGQNVSRRVKSKFVRAVNECLGGKGDVDYKVLFDHKGPTPKGAKKPEPEAAAEGEAAKDGE